MNDQQTKYVAELRALEQMADETDVAGTTAESTMPMAATQLARDMVDGLKVCQMSDDQKFFYKKFNLRIRTAVALRVAGQWCRSEIALHKAMAPDVSPFGINEFSDGE